MIIERKIGKITGTYDLVNSSNMRYTDSFASGMYNIIFADFVYENNDFSWVDLHWNKLSENGIFIAMTDHHTLFELGMKLKSMENSVFVNHCVWNNEWGSHPADRFHQCFDDILIFSNSKYFNFDKNEIQVEKKTLSKKLNPSGRLTKTATAWIDDCHLTTTAKERIKDSTGHLVKWQKPLKLMDRIINPFLNASGMNRILDLFAGSGTLAHWAYVNEIEIYKGFEIDTKVYKIASQRLRSLALCNQ
jgi:hypothetical protein